MNIHSSFVRAAMALAVLTTCDVTSTYAAVSISELTWYDSLNGNVTSTNGDGIDIDRLSTLVSFKIGGGTANYNSFVLANTTNASGTSSITPYWGVNAPNLTADDDSLSVTDTRLDTGMVNINNGANDFGFASSPSSLDQLLFIFDVGSADGSVEFALLDGLGGSVVGSSVNVNSSIANVANIDFERVDGEETVITSNVGIKGLAFSLSTDFGLTSSDLSSVGGVRITNGQGFDPALVGFAAIPEPSTALLYTLVGIFALTSRRPRQLY